MSALPTGIYRNQVMRETDKAVCIDLSTTRSFGTTGSRSNERTVWFPKSRIEWRSTQYGDELCAPMWLIRKTL
jgi:hypothetical protein